MGKGRAPTAMEMEIIKKKDKKQYQVKNLPKMNKDKYIKLYGEKAYNNYQANNK